ncbi:linear amide C-N hydrolase [Flammeovirga yaeyamensis]|uniref:Linear amide C-N hydrolase n=1 Tax=Flammeovirga yaeyamensis TaxID=367791 RepID=A0AAX1N6V5_9BACT|nr:choloylglycine hydrolase family protein [Flammeovirga yaeyamensis]MBB3697570.1 choloylglycine hydrolase [Flammeovirga yaeyamensis]NMF36262.1 choloylglycine hydrolase family protein [Flammeovirga yaeyamensis]QWG02991.1 linear amide C-N hydrolase [Flammeovirga yaeyamensis]
MKKSIKISSIIGLCLMLLVNSTIFACTGIRLIAEDGSVRYGRTMEWGSFDIHSQVAFIPKGFQFKGLTPEGQNGKVYTAKYGIVGLDWMGKDLIVDGMNEEGLAVGNYYFPNFAGYPEFVSEEASNTISSQGLPNYILSQFATVEEAKKGIQEVNVVGVIEESLGIVVDSHWMVSDATGASIVIEYIDGELKIYDASIGVITNAPSYDWHLTNLKNYINLEFDAAKPKTLNGETFTQTGVGSGMLGLPGDMTPPSRFVRAVAWTQTTRPMPNTKESMYEMFRILDNFNLTLGPDGAEGTGELFGKDHSTMKSSTIWTTSWDLTNKTFNYHTQHNRRVQQIDVNDIDFTKIGDQIVRIPLDVEREQDILNRTPKF